MLFAEVFASLDCPQHFELDCRSCLSAALERWQRLLTVFDGIGG